MAMTIDGAALGRGAATYVGIAAPCGLVIALLIGSDTPGHESNLWIVAFFLVIVVAPLAAGVVAGTAQEAPLVHGALAVAAPTGLFLVIRTVAGVVEHNLAAAEVVSFLLFLVVVTTVGMVGGYLGFRFRRRPA